MMILAFGLFVFNLTMLEHSRESVSEAGFSDEWHSRMVMPVEFKNGQFGIILRDETEGHPPSKDIPMHPNAQIPMPPIAGSESRTVSESIPALEIGENAHVRLIKGAEVASLHISGNAVVEIEESAHVSHVFLVDHATLSILPGADVSSVMGNDQCSVQFFGASPRLMMVGHSKVHLREKPDSANLPAPHADEPVGDGSIIYGTHVEIHIYSPPPTFQSGFLVGAWDSGTSYSIHLSESDEQFSDFQTPKGGLPSQIVVHPITGPSFNCAKVISPVEKIVCADPALASLDRRLLVRYKRGLEASADLEALKASQRRWLNAIRNGCTTAPCIKKAYERRIVVLEKLAKQSR